MKKLLIASTVAAALLPSISNAAIVPVSTQQATATATSPYNLTLVITGAQVQVSSSRQQLFNIKVNNTGAIEQLVDIVPTSSYKQGNTWVVKKPDGNFTPAAVIVGSGNWAGIGNAKTNGGDTASAQATIPAGGEGTLLVNAVADMPGDYTFQATLSAVTN